MWVLIFWYKINDSNNKKIKIKKIVSVKNLYYKKIVN